MALLRFAERGWNAGAARDNVALCAGAIGGIEREGIVGVGGFGDVVCGREEAGGGGKWGLRGEFAIGGGLWA